MTQAPVLALPDFTQPFTLEADASGYGIGAVLMQRGKPLSFFSKSIDPKAAALSTYDKEAMAIIEALKKWKHYFAASSLIIKTNQQSLKYIQEQKLTEGIQHKLLIKLLGYNYNVDYKKGKENRVADALSRVKLQLQALFGSAAIPAWISDVIQSYINDDKCKTLLAKLAVDQNAEENYTLNNGILRYKKKIVLGDDKELRTKIISSFHTSEMGGHSGERATYHRVQLVFYWTGMRKDIAIFTRGCPICQINKPEHTKYPGKLQPLHVPDMAWTHISMDFVECLPTSNNKDLILVVVDRFTKYAHFIAMKHPITVKLVAQAFTDNIFKLHSLPMVIVTDRDRIFTSRLWQDLFKALGIKLHMSTSYHPQTDGQTERVNQCLETYLRCMPFAQPKKWHSWLSMAEWWYNSSFHTSLKMTPFQALYGFPPPQVAEIFLADDTVEDVVTMIQRRQEANATIKENLKQAQERMVHFANQNRSDRQLQEGDMVYFKVQPYRHSSLSIHRCIKLHSKFYGQFRVLHKVGATAYKILLPEGCKLHHTFHVSQLKKYVGPVAVPTPSLPLIDDQGKIQTGPEAVLDRKLIPRTKGDISVPVVQWLIKWINLPPESATWEDSTFIQRVFPNFHP
jgi:hypothetical protein